MEQGEYETMACHEDSHWWFVGRRHILHRALEQLALPTNASILEVGAGTGGNIRLLQRFGTVTVAEPNSQARAWIRAATGTTALECTLPDTTALEERKFDLIAMLDVLEHIEDARGALVALTSHLALGGRFLVTVPAYQFLWSVHDENVHHFRRYTRRSFATVVTAAGLNVSCFRYFNSLLFPAVAVARLTLNLLGSRSVNEGGLPPALINKLLAKIFGAERHFVMEFPMPFGVSLLAIIEK